MLSLIKRFHRQESGATASKGLTLRWTAARRAASKTMAADGWVLTDIPRIPGDCETMIAPSGS